MSELDGRFVRRGIWTNLDEGEIMGKTITTDPRSGLIIVAIVAVMSTVGTSHLWNLLLFFVHQAQATGIPADGLARQQQFILRSLPPPTSLVADFTKLWWSWRKQNKRVLMRSMIQVIAATLCAAAFVAASVFSSSIVVTSDLKVLVNSPFCGHFANESPTHVQRSRISAIRAVSIPYSQECYRNYTIQPARCRIFIQPHILFTTESTSCPFSPEFCTVTPETPLGAIQFDSGPVDLDDGFGFNLPQRDRVSFRRQAVCTVLPLENRTTISNASDFPYEIWRRDLTPEERALQLHYGKRSSPTSQDNMTVVVSLLATNISLGFYLANRFYSLESARNGSEQTWEPLEGLRSNDADVTFIGLIASVTYEKPVHDPWFLALETQTIYDRVERKNITLYRPSSPVRALACTEQYQYCFRTKSGGECTRLDGHAYDPERLGNRFKKANPVQLSALKLLIASARPFNLVLSSDNLVEKMRQGNIVMNQVPSDQWILQARAMEAGVWSALQVSLADYALGPSLRSLDLKDYIQKPNTTGDKRLCQSQKMKKAGGFVNINVFGLVFVLVLSFSFAVIDMFLLKILVFVGRFKQNPRISRWVQDGVLQLQRRAYEAEQQGVWSNLDKEIPLTEPDKLLKELTLINANARPGCRQSGFPVLVSPQTSSAPSLPSPTRSSSATTRLLDQQPTFVPSPTRRQTSYTQARTHIAASSPQLSSTPSAPSTKSSPPPGPRVSENESC